MKELFRKRRLAILSRTLLLVLTLCFSFFMSLGIGQSVDTNNFTVAMGGELELMEITVQEGDSIATLATTYGITVSDFMELNRLDSTFIQVGLKLFVPTDPVTDITMLATSLDNLTGSSDFVEASVQETIPSEVIALTDANNVNNTVTETANEPANSLTVEPISTVSNATIFKTITVPQGATLSSIAITYGSSIEAIQSHNQLSGHTIYAGTELQIPIEQDIQTANSRQPDSTGYITVLPNDTISALATTFCSSPELLLGQNNLTSPDIFVGQRLFVGQINKNTAMLTEDSTSSLASFSEDSTLSTLTRVASLRQQTTP